jgi:DNA-binding transcriptional LysR family regulator
MNNLSKIDLWERWMDLSDLRIFSAVVREGGVTRAAEHLHRVQSNVTKRVRQLEDDLGAQLFLREGKRMRLTPEGRVLLSYADRLLAMAEEARAAVQDERPRGLLRLGSMESTAAVRLPGPLAEMSRLYPEVVLELRTGNPVELCRALLGGEIDAALVAEPVAEAKFDWVPAFEEETVIVTGGEHPPIGGADGVPSTVLVFENGCPHRKRLEEWYQSLGEMPERTIELGSYHAMLGCVLAGMGAALLPKSVLATFPESRRLGIHELGPQRGRLRTLLAWRKGALGANVKALADLLSPPPA